MSIVDIQNWITEKGGITYQSTAQQEM